MLNPMGDAVDELARIVALMTRSVEFRLQQDWRAALACLDEAVAINPRLPLGHIDRARLLAELKRYEEALDGYDAFLMHAGNSPEISDLRQELLATVFADLDQRLIERPGDQAARLARANLWRRTQHYAEALADYSAIVERDAQHADALNHQGSVLLALGRHDQAIDAYTRAVAAAPQRAELHYNLGNVLQQLGRFGEARAAYRQALARSPEFAEAQLELAHCDLAEGHYAAGWAAYEWRWRTAQMQGDRLPSAQPPWLGTPALSAKTILVWAEQGAGDTLQFVRLVPQLLADAAHVILRVQAPLRRLVESLDPRIEVIGDDQPLPAHDVQVPLLSLPLALRLDGVPPCPAPYLRADPRDVARWRERLGAAQRLRVGIAWAGRQQGLPNPTRDIAPAQLAPLAALPVDFISLQLPVAEALPQLRIFTDELADFGETAALIETLDLVLSVDTAVAHLAGALGKPCWLLLRASGEWRWQRERSDCPWYPSLTIFRQPEAGDWAGVISRVAAALLVGAGTGLNGR
ncbi:MAG: tetratricopeptide repeat protein [Proteobacteria bacterium]|nr:tetratricopeptide repeat protein [Pseudomonadota bacterium]